MQWVMQQQQPGACPGISEAGRRGMKSKEDVWVMEKSTSSSPVPYTAKSALVTLNTVSHTCPCEALITFYTAHATAGK